MVIEENVNTISVIAPKGHDLQITPKKNHKQDYSPFNMMSPFKNIARKYGAPGLLNLVISLSPSTQKLFVDILLFHLDMNTSIVTVKEWEKLGKSKLRSIYYKIAELKKANLLLSIAQSKGKGEEDEDAKKVGVGKFTYMINPYHTKPIAYDKAKSRWKALGGKVPFI